MNDDKIEELLRKAPAVKAPAGLLQDLQRTVKLPRMETSSRREFGPRSGLKRWLPALSFAAFMLGCFVVIGVQTSLLTDLKRENEALRAATPNLEQLRADNAEYKKLLAQSQELERLRQDNADLTRLRGEVAALKAKVQEMEKMRAEQLRLLAEKARNAAQLAVGAGQIEDSSPQAEAVRCSNNLKQIGLGARTWDGDHDDIFPTNYISMALELNNPGILYCPGDKSHNPAQDWHALTTENISYPMLAPGISERDDPHIVYVYCPIHHNYLLVDGSVHRLTPESEKTHVRVVNGRTILDP